MTQASFTRARLQASLAVLLTALLWWYHRGPFTATAAGLALALALLAWISPRHHAPIQRALDWLARALVTAFSWTMLALVYYGVFTPLRCLRALICHRFMPLQPDRRPDAPDSYLQPLRPRSPTHFERQF